jgi:hypothetical protein
MSKYITDEQNRTFYYEQGRRVYLDGKPDIGATAPSAGGAASASTPAKTTPEDVLNLAFYHRFEANVTKLNRMIPFGPSETKIAQVSLLRFQDTKDVLIATIHLAPKSRTYTILKKEFIAALRRAGYSTDETEAKIIGSAFASRLIPADISDENARATLYKGYASKAKVTSFTRTSELLSDAAGPEWEVPVFVVGLESSEQAGEAHSALTSAAYDVLNQYFCIP